MKFIKQIEWEITESQIDRIIYRMTEFYETFDQAFDEMIQYYDTLEKFMLNYFYYEIKEEIEEIINRG